MAKISLSRKIFDELNGWPLERLDAEISKNSIRAKLSSNNLEDETARHLQTTLIVLKSISLLRREKISRETFDEKIILL